jgi:hypothetical protein
MDDGVELAGQVEELGDVLLDEAETRVAETVGQVVLTATDQVVEDDDLVAGIEQAIGQMGSEEAGSAGDQAAHGSQHLRIAPPAMATAGRRDHRRVPPRSRKGPSKT